VSFGLLNKKHFFRSEEKPILNKLFFYVSVTYATFLINSIFQVIQYKKWSELTEFENLKPNY
jgi:hypothetical protein